MAGTYRIKERGVQILNLLKVHGPLSFRGIKQMLEPEIKDRRLHSALARFVKNKLITKRFEKLFRGYGIFYQLSQSEVSRTKLAQVLQCEPKELAQPDFRSRDLLHAESCAVWLHQIKKVLPDSVAIRDYQFQGSHFASEILLADRNEFELLPDLLVRFEPSVGQSPVTVAVEIEKTVKAKRRLQDKLKKYADGTALDGVMYVCERPDIQSAVASAYKSSVSGKSRRIGHYGDFFLLFSDENNQPSKGDIKMSTTDDVSVSLLNWIAEMRNAALPHRRTKNFELRAVSCSQK